MQIEVSFEMSELFVEMYFVGTDILCYYACNWVGIGREHHGRLGSVHCVLQRASKAPLLHLNQDVLCHKQCYCLPHHCLCTMQCMWRTKMSSSMSWNKLKLWLMAHGLFLKT